MSKTKRLFLDENFREGFTILARRHGRGGKNVPKDEFRYPVCQSEKPVWLLEQWHSRHCICKERLVTDDPYLLANDAKAIKYDPQSGILSMRLNARAEYEGRPHKDKRVLWPHLLLEQCMAEQFDDYSAADKPFYSADFKKLELDTELRMTDYKPTDNPEGINACQFMAYFYLTMKDDSGFVYFGVNFFDNREPFETYWALDVEGRAMIYLLSTKDTHSGLQNAFLSADKKVDIGTWHTIHLDLTPHIDKMVALLNSQNIFGRQVKREDLYVRGTNIGFEIHGNFDCTFEIKRYNLVSTI